MALLCPPQAVLMVKSITGWDALPSLPSCSISMLDILVVSCDGACPYSRSGFMYSSTSSRIFTMWDLLLVNPNRAELLAGVEPRVGRRSCIGIKQQWGANNGKGAKHTFGM